VVHRVLIDFASIYPAAASTNMGITHSVNKIADDLIPVGVVAKVFDFVVMMYFPNSLFHGIPSFTLWTRHEISNYSARASFGLIPAQASTKAFFKAKSLLFNGLTAINLHPKGMVLTR
jgi:hypothetical protein